MWFKQRVGRITASRFGEVNQKMVNILKNGKQIITVSPIVNSLMGRDRDISHVDPVAWGRSKEEGAKQAFVKKIGGFHRGLSVKSCGLMVSQAHPYMAATPDAMVTCQCCMPATVEVKCPYKARFGSIQDNWQETDFLIKATNGDIILKTSHNYYAQVQGQMALASCNRAYFVVWTPIGEPLVNIVEFNQSYWDGVSQRLTMFYKTYVVPKVLGKESLVYCPTCSKLCLEPYEISRNEQNSIQCSTCDLWYHFKCIQNTVNEDVEWYCDCCEPTQK